MREALSAVALITSPLALITSLLAGMSDPALAVLNYTEVPLPLPRAYSGDIAWVDFDSDGDLDIFLTGQGATQDVTELYRNDGGSFVAQGAALPPMRQSQAVWADFDRDGDVDLAMLGLSSGLYRGVVYRNDGGTFVETAASLLGVADGTLTAGDLDRDGDIDLWAQGNGNSGSYENVWGEDASLFVFTGQTQGIGTNYVGDLDGDGDADWLRAGDFGLGPVSTIQFYQIVGSDTPIVAASAAPGLIGPSIALGDVNGDGALDVAISGKNIAGFNQTLVYEGLSPHVQIDTMHGIFNADIAFGDADNDGDLDLALTGEDSAGPVLEIYQNQNANFSFGLGFSQKLAQSALAWGDYDEDGDLDLIVCGRAAVGSTATRLYRNDGFLLNTTPTVPTGISAELRDSGLRVSWNPSTDFETTSASLTYNLRIGTTPGGNELLPSASLPNGERLVVTAGNVGTATHYTLRTELVDPATLYFSVQAVDAALAVSAFSVEQSIFLSTTEVFKYTSTLPNTFFGVANVDNDGSVELFPTLKYGAFGDWDGDGDLDFVAGIDGNDTYLEINDGNGGFESLGIDLADGARYTADWGDYDNDGDLDLLFPDYGIYRNDNTQFTAVGGFPPLTGGYAQWGDFDLDGDLDVLAGGNNGADSRHFIYRNDGLQFVEITGGIPCNLPAIGCWTDFDGDGDLDAAIASEEPFQLFANTGGVFSEVVGAFPPGLECSARSLSCGDFDHDGDEDIVAAQLADSGIPFTRLLRNDGGMYSLVTIGTPNHSQGIATFFDHDNDGDLDIATAGYTGTNYYSAVYRNNEPVPNQMPAAPSVVPATLQGAQFQMQWSPGSDDHTPVQALTYNVRVGTSPGAEDVVPAMAMSIGLRKLWRRGNAGARISHTIDVSRFAGLPLYYTVQTIDGSHQGSLFAPEQVFDPNATAIAPQIESQFALQAPHPNPVLSSTKLQFTLAEETQVALGVYDVRGRQVRALVRKQLAAGRHVVSWDTKNDTGQRVAAGIYMIRLAAGKQMQTQKVLVRH